MDLLRHTRRDAQESVIRQASTTTNRESGTTSCRDLPANKLEEILSYVAHDLPVANVACRDGKTTLAEWIRGTMPMLEGVQEAAQELSPRLKLQLLQGLGLVLASGERHAQAAGQPPGWIVTRLPGLESALLTAASGSRVPVLTAEMYWERNDANPPLSFTGEPHERFFISAVRTQAALRSMVNSHIRGLLSGGWDPAVPEGARMLRAAAAAMNQAHGQYLDFRRGPSGAPLMTPQQFNEMRVWLTSTVVGGRTFAGANAAYIPEMVVTDFLLGTADDDYHRYVRSFGMYQAPEGRRLIDQDRARTPLVLVLARALGMSEQALEQASVAEVGARVREAPLALIWSLGAFKELVEQFIGSSGAHIGLVHVYLEKYARELPQDELDRMPVKPIQGTGGHSHEHTRRLHDMRRRCPRIRKLITALRESAPPEAA